MFYVADMFSSCNVYLSLVFLLVLKLIASIMFFLMYDQIQLNFFSEPDGPVTGGGNFKSSVLVPGYALFNKCTVS